MWWEVKLCKQKAWLLREFKFSKISNLENVATRQPRFQHCQGHIEQLCNDGHSARLPLVPAINRGFPLSFSLFSLYLEFLPLQLSTTAFALPLAFLVMFYSDFLSRSLVTSFSSYFSFFCFHLSSICP